MASRGRSRRAVTRSRSAPRSDFSVRGVGLTALLSRWQAPPYQRVGHEALRLHTCDLSVLMGPLAARRHRRQRPRAGGAARATNVLVRSDAGENDRNARTRFGFRPRDRAELRARAASRAAGCERSVLDAPDLFELRKRITRYRHDVRAHRHGGNAGAQMRHRSRDGAGLAMPRLRGQATGRRSISRIGAARARARIAGATERD